MSKNFHNSLKNRKTTRDWLELSSFIHFGVSLILFGVVFAINKALASESGEAPIPPIGILIISLSIFMFGLHLRERQNFRKYCEELGNVKESTESLVKAHRVERYTSRERASQEVMMRVPFVKDVKNTFFPNRNKRVGSLIANPEAVGIFETWFNNKTGQLWHDIVGPEEFFDSRYKVQNHAPVFGVKTHRINVLKHGVTCPNFTILTYDDDTEEVFWGWISELHAKSDSDVPYVFSSTENEIVKFYRELFNILTKQKTWGGEITRTYSFDKPLPKLTSNQIVDKVGFWVNCSYQGDTLSSVGFYKIEVMEKADGRRGFVMNGYTFGCNCRVIEIVNHVDGEISHYADKMFIEYGLDGKHGRKGFCFYEFRKDGLLSGFYTAEDSNEKFSLLGEKFEEENFLLPDLRMNDLATSEIIQSVEDMFRSLIEQKRISDKIASKWGTGEA